MVTLCKQSTHTTPHLTASEVKRQPWGLRFSGQTWAQFLKAVYLLIFDPHETIFKNWVLRAFVFGWYAVSFIYLVYFWFPLARDEAVPEQPPAWSRHELVRELVRLGAGAGESWSHGMEGQLGQWTLRDVHKVSVSFCPCSCFPANFQLILTQPFARCYLVKGCTHWSSSNNPITSMVLKWHVDWRRSKSPVNLRHISVFIKPRIIYYKPLKAMVVK